MAPFFTDPSPSEEVSTQPDTDRAIPFPDLLSPVVIPAYSCRKASIGSIFAALSAGK
jgi:hypothetical protein